MNDKIHIVWVDDESDDRTPDKEKIEKKQRKIKIDLIHPDNLDNSIDQGTPDLFLIDYFLNKCALKQGRPKSKKSEEYPYKGLTVESIIREKFPDVPIYCTSVHYKELKNDPIIYSINLTFERFFALKQIQNDGDKILYYDALDFKTIKESEKNDVSSIFTLLNAPEEEKEKILLTLPSSLRVGLYHNFESNSLVLAKWINNILFQNPGILYNELYSATFFGMTIEAFRSISSKREIIDAQYNGIFSRTNESYWWKSKLMALIFTYPKITEYPDKYPWVVAPDMFKIPKVKRSKCIVCKKEFPECVGININNLLDQHPVHIRCSEPYTKKKAELYFEEFRGYKTT